MQFSDLPNGGHNLRLYTYDPIGSQFGPKNSCGSEATNTWIYNTGHYDISLGTPCSQPDPQGFCDFNTMAGYAGSRGESLVMVSRSDLTVLCGYRAPAVQTTIPRPVTQSIAPIGPGGTTPSSGGITSSGITNITVTTPPVVAGAIPPPGTPIDSGGLPGGVGTSGAAVNPVLSAIYRFILYDPSSDPNNPYATGASYPGCSQTNTVNCQAKSFPTQDAAVAYALAHGEIPYLVLNANEPWAIINGTEAIDPTRILGQSSGMSWLEIAAIAAGAWFLSGR